MCRNIVQPVCIIIEINSIFNIQQENVWKQNECEYEKRKFLM